MGVYVLMDILPNKIGKEEWESVYEESLELIKAYPFMDSTVDYETYRVPWKYVHRPTEEEMEFGYKDFYLGWHVFGDYETMLSAESFGLFRNIEAYRKDITVKDGSDDILAELINLEVFYDEKNHHIPVGTANVFDGKTQGFPYHIYILAIACLVESRFPKHAVVRGDVSIGQMKKAIDWANTILKKPIQLTERTNNEKFLQRIIDIVQDDRTALRSFMSLTMHKKDFTLGNLVREKFSQDVINAYYTDLFRQYDVNMMGFHNTLRGFFNLGFSIEKACEICVLNLNGCCFDAKDFAETVLSMRWSDEKGSYADGEIPLTYNETHSDVPETVYSQFGKTMLIAAGLQEKMKSELSYEDVGNILHSKLGHKVEIEPMLVNEQDNDDSDDDSFSQLFSRLKGEVSREINEPSENTISDLNNLILWKKGDTIHPTLEHGISHLKDFVTKFIKNNDDLLHQFQEYTDYEKIQKLIQLNRFFYIRKETWEFYIENINDTNMINAILGILSVKAEEVSINKLCKAIVNNVDLLKKYIL
ncbi:hypothetical protein NC797_08755 [Aquibacillus sp. 3ASR75-11]|uniref:Uncharacterized protein n=1 Tax=Terrihalobacillus insolitus TaxID=2950438 RepID=A0A9X4ANJ4_9BACI|nr:hypothetical protein [Terrihalobacillus insolitus]MDC3413865.1 hypothetical protein [Terrihalobacillus insolitus]MDC3424598.1 hypothetical protein [Terrihalobacillus insolitus]